MTVFGDVGRELLPVLQRGGRAIDAYSAELEELGGGVSANSIEASQRLGFAMNRLDLVMTSVKDEVLAPLIPVLERVTLELVEMFSQSEEGAEVTRSLGEAAVALGQAFVAVIPLIVGFVKISSDAISGLVGTVREMDHRVPPFFAMASRCRSEPAIGVGSATRVRLK